MARYDLRLSGDEFFALTPRQFDAMLKRKKVETVDNEFLFAQLTAWIVNTGFKSPEKLTSAADFMPSERAKKSKSKPKSTRMTKQRRADIDKGIRSMFPNLHPKA